MSVDLSSIKVSKQYLFDSIKRDKYAQDPVLWCNEVLKSHLWSKQREIIESVRDNRRTAVQSCHGAGKSYIAARIAAWWLSVHPPGRAKVITSAPTGDQVRAILWQEIARAHSSGNLPGRLNQTEWWITLPDGREEMVGIGRKPAEHNPAAFQGIHERYILVIFDESSGMPKSLYTAADGLLSNDDCRILSIGNPDDPLSEFANECRPGSGANVITISAFDTPNFTGEKIPDNLRHFLVGETWVNEKKKRWGVDNPLYIAKVLGQFPEISSDSLIPISWIRAAQERTIDPSLSDINELGVDIGGGSNKSTICHRRGSWARIIHRDQNPDTMETLGRVIMALDSTKATRAKVDKTGIGWGLVNRGEEQGKPIVGVNLADPVESDPRNPDTKDDSEKFLNLRAKGFWGLRTRFQDGDVDIDPEDEDLAAQLVRIKWKPNSRGQIQIFSKSEMRKDMSSIESSTGNVSDSPDDADALMLAFLDYRKKLTKLVWD